ncbi:MAG: protein TolR [Legionellaceae bacterium]|nr:protein TolR [Legionellaceae bacterium]
MRKRQRETPKSDINVVPYIDVMLVLLVIFMITAPMLSQGVTVDLPKTASTETLSSEDREPIIVSVDKTGNYYLNISDAPEMPMEDTALVTRVAAELIVAKEAHQRLPVLVKGDQGVPYGKVVLAMGLLKQAGAEQVGLLTESSAEASEDEVTV